MADYTKHRRHRSPSFPFVNLETAIARARELHEHERTHPAHVGTVTKHWGFSGRSSGGLQTIGALKQYGLLEDAGGKLADRKVRLTNLARHILLQPDDSPDRSQHLREAALKPALFSEMFSKWSGELPSDENIRSYLLLERNFNEKAVFTVIKNYKDSISYSRATDSDTMSGVADGSDLSSQSELEKHDMETIPTARQVPSSAMVFSWPLAKGVMAEVRLYGGEIGPNHLERLREYLDLAKAAVASDDDGD